MSKSRKSHGIGLAFRGNSRGGLNGSSLRLPGMDVSFKSHRRGKPSGTSTRLTGLNLTFHTDRKHKALGTSMYIPGVGTFSEGRNGNMKSLADLNWFRSTHAGNSKGNNRRI